MTEDNFVDYVKINVRSGNGGKGSAHLRREKYVGRAGKHEVVWAKVRATPHIKLPRAGPEFAAYCAAARWARQVARFRAVLQQDVPKLSEIDEQREHLQGMVGRG